MSVISMKQLLEAGVHFGHQTRRWNPKMAPYIYTDRNGIHIIDLQKSVGMVDDAYEAVKNIEKRKEDGTFDVLPKKEVILLEKELEKLTKNLGGIKDMKKLPDAIFVVDPKKEKICVQEAHSLNIPLIGIADTNCDPDELDYVIPGNDDAIRAVKLIVSKMADAVIEANQGESMAEAEADAEEVKTEE